MILHVGRDVTVRGRDIVGIFDMDNTTVGQETRRFLADAEKGGRVVDVTAELPRSFVVCAEKDGSETVYLSQIAPATLKKRAQGIGV
ncbi:MAG: DUF370 domain-containing protein [Ruminococcaceae bacterium]|nr:DUF370 domain-containing protein [Oscillospiraceae bacterium]MBQ2780976.1 DUF370 domain-containing protein [Clostridia bacterium]MBQ7303114.1 DUF370 domain-containing protein [Clostridia bacterium]